MLPPTTHAAIVRSIMDLGRDLGLRVVGGVETIDPGGAKDFQLDVAQGHVLAPPMPRQEIGHEAAAAPVTAA